MRLTTTLLLFAAWTVLFAACNKPECKNTNEVFDKYSPQSNEYKVELAKQMRRIGTEHVRYWYEGYRQDEGSEYIITNIQGKGLCAKGEILVTDWAGIEGLRGPEANGYDGAELTGLKLDIAEDSEGVAFIFKELDRIVD